jgi:hypothetical protein
MTPAAIIHTALQVCSAIVMIAGALLEHAAPDASLGGHPVLLAGGAVGLLSTAAHWIESHRSIFDQAPMTLVSTELKSVAEHPADLLAKLEPVLRKLSETPCLATGSTGAPAIHPDVLAAAVKAAIEARS